MIWITWEKQRRSVELAKVLGAHLYIIQCSDSFKNVSFLRYATLGFKTLITLLNERPKLLFIQNPSIVLAACSCIFKYIFRYKLIVDRHSNFKFDEINTFSIKMFIFKILSDLTLKFSDVTIVTNEYLADHVRTIGGNAVVLEDKLPELNLCRKMELVGEKNIVFISTYSEDEPIVDVIDAARKIPRNWMFYVTGNYKNYKLIDKISSCLPSNVTLTGFLSEEDYQRLLYSVDLIVVLTKNEYTLTCGTYEGLSLEKPMVVSDTKTIREYFNKGVVYSLPDSESISNAIVYGIENCDALKEDMKILKQNLRKDWNIKLNNLLKAINPDI